MVWWGGWCKEGTIYMYMRVPPSFGCLHIYPITIISHFHYVHHYLSQYPFWSIILWKSILYTHIHVHARYERLSQKNYMTCPSFSTKKWLHVRRARQWLAQIEVGVSTCIFLLHLCVNLIKKFCVHHTRYHRLLPCVWNNFIWVIMSFAYSWKWCNINFILKWTSFEVPPCPV